MSLNDLRLAATRKDTPGYPVSRGKRGAIVKHLNDICGGDDGRKAFLAVMFKVGSAKELVDADWRALWEWLSPACVDYDTNEWAVRAECRAEAQTAIRAAQVAAGQLEMAP